MKLYYSLLLILGLAGIIDACIVSSTTSIYNFGTWFPGLLGIALLVISTANLTGKLDTLVLQHRKLVRFVRGCFIVWGLSFILVEGYIYFPDTTPKFTEPDYVVILGAGLNGDKLSWLLSERMVTALEYLKYHPNTKTVVSGGQGPDEAISEAEAMRDFLIANGIAAQRIVIEDKSKSTLENFKFIQRLLPARENKIVVVTSNFHMRRAALLAERTGFTPESLPSSTPYTIALNCYLREYFALVKSYILDR